MTSHMEEPGRNAARVGKILISASDYPCMKVRVINNSGGLCIISHSTEEGWKLRAERGHEQFNVRYLEKKKEVFSGLPQLAQVIQRKILNANESQIKPRKQTNNRRFGTTFVPFKKQLKACFFPLGASYDSHRMDIMNTSLRFMPTCSG